MTLISVLIDLYDNWLFLPPGNINFDTLLHVGKVLLVTMAFLFFNIGAYNMFFNILAPPLCFIWRIIVCGAYMVNSLLRRASSLWNKGMAVLEHSTADTHQNRDFFTTWSRATVDNKQQN